MSENKQPRKNTNQHCSKALMDFKAKILKTTEGPYGVWYDAETMTWLRSNTATPKDAKIRSSIESTNEQIDNFVSHVDEEEEEEEEEDAD